ncbi:DUF2332 domain-containing protein [Microbacterium protaetiae]|uniref:DUF2332 domain-containing protein n=1 Tax=Microbacterium protaetiae TaxID=2509458 RepID=A0A4V0YDR6_9MICO|nr:DUF2332 domain-containing protein [Microbacterium protaetiae]
MDAVQQRYRRFAVDEAPHRSPLYAQWAARVAHDATLAAVLARVPAAHRSPPLVFAVARMLGCGLCAPEKWAAWMIANADAVVEAASERGVQTNEPLRCAALLPALSRIEGPIALLEVGASAGLCLYPDRYSYRYRTPTRVVTVDPHDGPSAVVLEAQWRGEAPTLRMPQIVWRAGIDLQPRDAADPADRSWLTGLVWPGEGGRAQRIRAALDIVAADPPRLVAGDATTALSGLMAEAPKTAALVVTTPGVLALVPREGRELIVAAAQSGDHWITMDAAGLHSSVAGRWAAPEPAAGQATAPGDPTEHGARHPAPESAQWPNGVFALAIDGEVIAAVDPLGAIVEPIGADREWHPVDASTDG